MQPDDASNSSEGQRSGGRGAVAAARAKAEANPIDPASPVKPWDRMPNEPPDAFAAFCAYRDMPAVDRSVRKAYFTFSGQTKTMNGGWFKYSSTWNWLERATQYDVFTGAIAKREREKIEHEESARLEHNRRTHRDNECYLAELGMQRARDILSMPVVRDSYIERVGDKLIMHKATLISPSHLFAAAALMKASSQIGRQGLGIKDEDGADVTPEEFKRLLFKTKDAVAKAMPKGAMPQVIDGNQKPDVRLPSPDDASASNPDGTNGDRHAMYTIEKSKPPRARP
jgi:hypothetical protein